MTKKSVSLISIVFSATLFVVGCKGPGDLDGLTNINVNFNERVTIQATFENGNEAATISDVRVTWDGQIVQESAIATPVERVMVSGVRLGKEKGGHRLAFRIVNQTSSPNTYRVTGLAITSYDTAGAVVERLALDPRTAALETDESITYDFRL